ncbi:MAG: S8 family serine peptidase [Actinomycetota bacterium]
MCPPRWRTSMLLGAALVALVVSSMVPAAGSTTDDGVVDAPATASTTGRLMVRVAGSVGGAGLSGADVEAVSPGWIVVDPGDGDIDDLADQLAERPGVLEVRPEAIYEATLVPDDPCFDSTTDCRAATGLIADQRALSLIGAPAAWDVTTGSESITIAVLDSSIRRTHDDLVTNSLDWTSCGMAATPNDPFHGSRVGGLAGASADDGIGIAGLGFDTRIADVPVLRRDALNRLVGSESDVVNAIRCATDRGASVINMSFAGAATPALEEALAYAFDRGVVLVAAAGNAGTDAETYPAAYPQVIGVGSTDLADATSSFSSRGPWVSIAAPGEALISTGAASDSDYDINIQGTSFSSPLVAAAAALLRAAEPTWSPAEIAARLARTSTAHGGAGTDVASGRLDVGAALTAEHEGYWIVTADGEVFPYGDAIDWGEPTLAAGATVVAIEPAPDGRGYWIASSDGAVLPFGSARSFGSMAGQPLNQPIVGMAATNSGLGYWLVASDGGIFAFGDATFLGSMGGTPLNEPIVAMATVPTGDGYWLVASDGGIFAFGDAPFFGSMGGTPLNLPVVGMAESASGAGYWLVAADGGIFAFGDAPFHGSTGSLVLNQPIVGMTATASGDGYRMVATDGGIFSFGGADFFGSAADEVLNAPAAATGGFS